MEKIIYLKKHELNFIGIYLSWVNPPPIHIYAWLWTGCVLCMSSHLFNNIQHFKWNRVDSLIIHIFFSLSCVCVCRCLKYHNPMHSYVIEANMTNKMFKLNRMENKIQPKVFAENEKQPHNHALTHTHTHTPTQRCTREPNRIMFVYILWKSR